MANEVARVDFHGDTIEAVCSDGQVWVSVRRICESLGIDRKTQQEKLQNAPWATGGLIPLVAADGATRLGYCILLDSLPMWLATIDANRVSADIRPKLQAYQCEAANALERHFLRRATPTRFRPWAERFRESFAPHSQFVLSQFPQGAFTVITEGVMSMLMLEDELIRHVMEVRAGDRPCVSIGLTWSHYRKKVLLRTSSLGEAPIFLPDKGITVPVKVYSDEDLHLFKTWLHFVYLPEKLPAYLDHKPELKQYGALPRASVADNTCLTLTGRHASLPEFLRRRLTISDGFAPASIPHADRPQLPPM